MKVLLPLAILGLLGLSIAGCNKEAPADSAPVATSTPAPGGAPDAVANKATIKNEPDANAAPGAGYRIKPANPDDPKYKADPRLAGGN